MKADGRYLTKAATLRAKLTNWLGSDARKPIDRARIQQFADDPQRIAEVLAELESGVRVDICAALPRAAHRINGSALTIGADCLAAHALLEELERVLLSARVHRNPEPSESAKRGYAIPAQAQAIDSQYCRCYVAPQLPPVAVTRMKKVHSSGIAVLLATVLMLVATAPHAAETMSLRLAQSTPLVWPQTRIASASGLWAKHGLDVKPTLFATGREAMQALLGGQADVAEVAPTPLVLAAFAGQPVRAFAVAARWSPWRVLVRVDSGVSDASQLKGKRIGISVGTSSDLAFSYFLDKHGVSKSSVQIVNVSPPDMIPALDSGSVDAINIWQPFTYEAERRLGARIRGLPYTFTNNYLLLTTNDVAAKNPELLKRMLAVMKDADKVLTDDREKAIEWTSKASGMKPEAVKAVWAEMELGTSAPDARVLEEMQHFAAFAIKNKFVKEGAKMPDLKALFLVP